MPPKRKIGIFWGNNSLYFAETSDGQVGRMFSVPIGDSNDANKNMAVSSLIKETLQKAGLTTSTPVQVSLATKDIIFRSFLIPWMQASEVRSAVAFEAPKYIPFPLEELSYAYHYFTVGEGAIKKNRIVFAAIKKDALEGYKTTLEQASLKVESMEPSSSSLIRLLIGKELIPNNVCLALIEKGEVNCKITIVDSGIPQFVREFQLGTMGQTEGPGGKAVINRLLNEIRISLDFYQRQDPAAQLKQIKLISTLPSKDLITAIGEEMKIPVAVSQPKTLLKKDDANEIGFLNAVGASLSDLVPMPSSFNFLGGPIRTAKQVSFIQNLKFSAILPAIVFSGVVLSAAVLTPRLISQKPKMLLEEVNVQLGSWKDSLIEKIQERTTTSLDKITQLKRIRTESEAASILETIPKLLPAGAWLDELILTYPSDLASGTTNKPTETDGSKLDVAISGFAYSENTQEQFGIVSKYLVDLKNQADFVKHFQKIELETVRSQQQEEFTVTFFKIRCY